MNYNNVFIIRVSRNVNNSWNVKYTTNKPFISVTLISAFVTSRNSSFLYLTYNLNACTYNNLLLLRAFTLEMLNNRKLLIINIEFCFFYILFYPLLTTYPYIYSCRQTFLITNFAKTFKQKTESGQASPGSSLTEF